ncbi:MAG: molybdopterin-dependent oxidoreductase, partial [bacterium]|nr:molybdopterin-dependent oxidoreductase [bacterium]
MKKMYTVCARDCYDTCSLVVTLDNDEHIVSIQGDPNHPITQGFVCPRGAKDHERLLKNRVQAPFLRQNGTLVEAKWDQSLDVAAQKLRELLDRYGPGAVLSINYAGNMGLLSGAFSQRIWNALGATQTDRAICSESGNRGIALHYGDRYGTQPEELLEMDLIVFWGFNPAVSASHLWSPAKKARRTRGTKIVVVDPRKSQSAAQADLWIQLRPGTDVALSYGVMNRLIRQDAINRDFINQWTRGFDSLQEEVRQWTPEKVEEFCGVPRETLAALADMYARLTSSTTMIGIGFQKNDTGADQVRAVSLIPALLGLHRGFFYSNGSAFFVDGDLVSGSTLTQKPSEVVPQVALADLVSQGHFKFIFISCMNPAMTLPNQNLFRAGLERDDVFVVTHETHWTATCD